MPISGHRADRHEIREQLADVEHAEQRVAARREPVLLGGERRGRKRDHDGRAEQHALVAPDDAEVGERDVRDDRGERDGEFDRRPLAPGELRELPQRRRPRSRGRGARRRAATRPSRKPTAAIARPGRDAARPIDLLRRGRRGSERARPPLRAASSKLGPLVPFVSGKEARRRRHARARARRATRRRRTRGTAVRARGIRSGASPGARALAVSGRSVRLSSVASVIRLP